MRARADNPGFSRNAVATQLETAEWRVQGGSSGETEAMPETCRGCDAREVRRGMCKRPQRARSGVDTRCRLLRVACDASWT